MTSRTPTDPMTDGWPPRTAQLLTAWTLLLLGLVLIEIRHLPPVLTVLLLPYLALIAWHGVSGLRRFKRSAPARALDGASGSLPEEGASDKANSPGTAETTETAP